MAEWLTISYVGQKSTNQKRRVSNKYKETLHMLNQALGNVTHLCLLE